MKIFSADITGSTAAAVQAYDNNPTAPAITDGSIWINRGGSINFSFTSGSVAAGVWSAGGVFPSGRLQGAGFGSQNAFAYTGGNYDHEDSQLGETFEYDGSAFSDASADLTQVRGGLGSAGTQNAGVVFGGYSCQMLPAPVATTCLDCTEEYNGTAWSTAEAMNQGRSLVGGQGTQNASLAFGGARCAGTYFNIDYSCVEEYDGTDWAAGNVFNAYVNAPTNSACGGASIAASGGSQNSTLIMGGGEAYYAAYNTRLYSIASSQCFRDTFVELYDGTSWSTQTAFSEQRMAASAFGTANDTVMAGGSAGYGTTDCSTTCLWDGSAWSTGNNLNVGRADAKPTNDGSANAGFIAGGFSHESSNTYDYTNFRCCTEEWNRNITNTLTSKELVAKDGIISASNLTNMSISSSLASTSSFGLGKFTSVNANNTIITNNSVSSSLASTASFGRVRAQGTISGGKFVGDGTGLTGVTAALFDGDNKLSGSLTSTGSFGNVKGAGTIEANVFKGDGSQLTNVATSNTIEITGSLKVQSTEPLLIPLLTADPAISSLGPGSLWINRVTGALNFSYLSSSITDKTWSAGGTIGDSKVFRKSVGTQNAQILFNGHCPPPAPASSNSCISEEVKCYDGTSWTVSPASTTAEAVARGGVGLQNSTIAFGGLRYEGPNNAYDGNLTCSEEYDGTTWTEGNEVTLGRTAWAGVGTQNDVIAFSGFNVRSGYAFTTWMDYFNASYTGVGQNETVGYDGTSWVACNDTTIFSGFRAGFGTPEAAVAAGGSYDGGSGECTQCTEEWDGTSWASGETMTVGRSVLSGAGTQNDGVVFGGRENSGYSNTYHNDTEIYDGTNWSTGPTMSTARMSMGGGGSSTAAFMVGSWDRENSISVACCTEEYTEGSLDTTLVKTITGSAYSY